MVGPVNANPYPPHLAPFAELGASFARRELLERRAEHDAYPFAPFWDGVVERAASLGFFGMNLPEERGGSGAGTAPLTVLCEETSRVDASLAGIIFATAAAVEIITGAGEPYDERALDAIAGAGARLLAFQSYTHPDEAARPLAYRQGGAVYVKGTARNLVLGGIAGMAVIAGSDPGQGFSYYLVGMKDAGVSVSETVHAIGFRACPMIDASFDETPALPLGGPGSGPALYRRMAERMSAPAAAILLGIMRGSFEEARAYAAERRQGGRAIIDWPQVTMMLADMALAIETGEAGLAECLSRPGADARPLCLALGDRACDATADGVQILGGNGYMSDYGQEKRMRDARMARMLLGMPALRKLDFARGACPDTAAS